MSKIRGWILIPLLLAVCAVLGGVYGPKVAATQNDSPDNNEVQIRNDLRQFAQVYALVENNYAVPVNADEAIYDGAIPGMLRVLDPHSSFYDPQSFARMREDESVHYFGVGMSIQMRGDRVIVQQPFEGTPAYRAGLRPGDVIAAVDGKSAIGLPADEALDDVATMLKGPKGTAVHVSIERTGHGQPLQFTLVRAEVHHSSVDCSYAIAPGVLYLHLANFQSESAAQDVADAINAMGGPDRLKGMVLDLRQNPGGLLSQAVELGDQFLAKGQLIVSHHGRSSPEREYRALDGNGGADFPLVVLVNDLTASASEIVSGAIQDHDRGLIVGQTTFGKGLVQTVYPLSDNTALALTSAHYYTPSGRLIQRPYKGLSLYDYYWARNATPTSAREVRTTDSGRTVYGGGGITPDVVLKPSHYAEFDPPIGGSDFQQDLLDRWAFYDFADYYLSEHSSVPRDWQPDATLLADFKTFLASDHIPYSQSDLDQNATWIELQAQRQILTNLYGQNAGLEALTKTDPEVQRALQLLPAAQALETHARQILAERQAGGQTP